MRLVWIAFAAGCVALVMASCSPGDQHKTTKDIQSVAGDIPGTIRDGTNSPHGAELQAGVKDLAHDTGKALKEGAEETKQALDKQVDKEKR